MEARAIFLHRPFRNALWIQGCLGTVLAWTAVTPVLAADSRGAVTLRWTAPDNQGDAASAYRLRKSTVPPGSDLEAWWNSATPEFALPSPSQPGQQDHWNGELAAGQTWYLGIKSSDAEGDWSALTEVASIATAGDPFLQGVSPQAVSTGVPTSFVLTGLGMDEITAVQFKSGNTVTGGVGLNHLDAKRVSVSVTLPAGAQSVEVVALSPSGSDVLRGWVTASAPQEAPPTTVSNLAASPLDYHRVRLSWTAPADNLPVPGTPVTTYRIRRMGGSPGNWDWGLGDEYPPPVPKSPGSNEIFEVSGLASNQIYAFALISRDAAGNWSTMSNVAEVYVPQAPIEDDPPEAVDDLEAVPSVNGTQVVLTWTAPEDPAGSKADLYQVRMMEGPGMTWEDGEILPSSPPQTPGSLESLPVTGLTPGSYPSFAVRTRGATGEWSAVSNFASVVLPGDTLAPEAVSDLAAELITGDLVQLTWTGVAATDVAAYELRRSEEDPLVWETADPVAEIDPGNPGEILAFNAGEVAPGQACRWALVSRDFTGNRSAMSNVVGIDRIEEDITPPVLNDPLEADQVGHGRVQLRWRAPGDDGSTGPAHHYELVVVENPNLFTSWWESAPAEVLPLSPKAPGKREFYNVPDLPDNGSVFGLALRAVDEAGLSSAWISALISVGQGGGADASPPAAPDGVTAYRTETGVFISWNPSPDPEVEFYFIYEKRNQSVHRLTSVPTGTYQVVLPLPGQETLQYSVTAVDAGGNESGSALWQTLQEVPPAPTLTPLGTGWELRIPAGSADTQIPRVAVYDIQGRLVANPLVLPDGPVWRVAWDGQGRSGSRLASGVYFMRTLQEGSVHTAKVVLRP